MIYSELYGGLGPKKGYNMSNAVWANAYLGAPTSPEDPNQLKQILSLVPSGIQNVEVGVLNPSVFEEIPKQHFEQMKQLAKLTIRDFEKEGKPSPLSMHAPLIEPTGFTSTESGESFWREDTWKTNIEQLKDVITKATELGTSTPITIHGSHTTSNITRYDEKKAKEYLQKINDFARKLSPEMREKYLENHEQDIGLLKSNEIPDTMMVIDPESGQTKPLHLEEVHYPNYSKLETPSDRLTMMNHTFWQNKQQEIAMTNNEVRKLSQEIEKLSGKKPDELDEDYREKNPYVDKLLSDYDVFKSHRDSQISSAFDKAVKAAELEGNKEQLDYLKFLQKSQFKDKNGKIVEDSDKGMIAVYKVMPDIFIPVEDFARSKASETFAELALKSIEVAGKKGLSPDKAPIISVENINPAAAFGKGESMRKLIESSRQKFVQKAVASGKFNASEAKKLSEKLIGTTWDVGHINLMKRYGYEDKHVMAELEKVKENIKHVHITDNFGYHDSHLPPGMGNVPVKEVLKELEKAGKMGEIRAIVEAGNYVAKFKQVPTAGVLAELNSPIYSAMGNEGWGDRSNYFFGSSGYGSGYGNILPSEHFSMYGAGFSQLPTALGGMKGGGDKSKFSDTPMS